MLARRLRRWPNIEPILIQCIVFAGMHHDMTFLSILVVVQSLNDLDSRLNFIYLNITHV